MMFTSSWAWFRSRSRSSLFFFSSRRRHTRFDCDWSSDVCSSDIMIRHTRFDCDWSSDVCSSDLPEERWQTARDVALELKWIAEAGSESSAATPVKDRRNSEWLMMAALVVTAAAAVTLGVL